MALGVNFFFSLNRQWPMTGATWRCLQFRTIEMPRYNHSLLRRCWPLIVLSVREKTEALHLLYHIKSLGEEGGLSLGWKSWQHCGKLCQSSRRGLSRHHFSRHCFFLFLTCVRRCYNVTIYIILPDKKNVWIRQI